MCINFGGKTFLLFLFLLLQHMPCSIFYPHSSTKFLVKQCKMWGTIFGEKIKHRPRSRFYWAEKSLHMVRGIEFQVLSKIVSCHLLHFTMKTTLGAVLSFPLSLSSKFRRRATKQILHRNDSRLRFNATLWTRRYIMNWNESLTKTNTKS